jgi:CcmD family protein
MENFRFLFTAWMAVWAVFFVYEFSIARRMSRLKSEMAELKQRLHEPRTDR